MTETLAAVGDPLLLLRQSIANASPPVLTTASAVDPQTNDFAVATHLTFTSPTPSSFPLSTATRFVSSDQPVDLRSIYFAWQHKTTLFSDYTSSAQILNEALAASEQNAGAKVHSLVFVERLDLITWLEGASDDSEHIKPLKGDSAVAAAAGAAQALVGAAAATASNVGVRTARNRNPILQAIYNNERRMGDRNSILRGIKPTDFSHVRKAAEQYLRAGKQSSKPGAPITAAGPNAPTTTLASRDKPGKPSRRPDPIILLSPSASSLLRMSNIKSFLNEGTFIPADSNFASSTASILHISRTIPSVDTNRPLRFILVDSPDQFKPDYWDRVVAVFTTGQAWQFKSYKWQTPQDLFGQVLGIYVGWRGDQVNPDVRGWGSGVATVQIDKWRGEGVGRWRDREVVEGLWSRIEEQMRKKGWGTAGPGR